MPTIWSLLSRHHRICDERLEHSAEAVGRNDWEVAANCYGSFRNELSRHIRLEEDALFPAFEKASGTTEGPTAVMRLEHARIAILLDELERDLHAHDADGFQNAYARFSLLMSDHNRKEEQILYPACDRLLGRDLDTIVAHSELLCDAAPPLEDVVVDACWLQPPEPMEKVVAALESLHRGQRVRFLIHREPMPLYRMLQQNDYRWRTSQREDGTYEILIWAA